MIATLSILVGRVEIKSRWNCWKFKRLPKHVRNWETK